MKIEKKTGWMIWNESTGHYTHQIFKSKEDATKGFEESFARVKATGDAMGWTPVITEEQLRGRFHFVEVEITVIEK